MKKQKLVAGAMALGILALGAGAAAASQIEDVVAQINYGFKMKLNGVAFNPTESDGSAIRPLIYKGRTYLPVATLGNALGVAVKWDSETATVLIGENEKVTDLTGIIKNIDQQAWQYTTNKELLYSNGQTFDRGLVLINDYNPFSANKLVFHTKGQYSKLGFTLATESTEEFKCEVVDRQNNVIEVISVDNTGPKTYEIDISGNDLLCFDFRYGTPGFNCAFDPNKVNAKVVFGDIYLK